jgi:ELWxxDGT repeat protein
VSDGTTAGTRLVADLTPGAAGTLVDSQILVVGDTAYFLARTAGSGGLWETDGTAAGTRRLAAPGDVPVPSTLVDDPTAGGGVRLYFAAREGVHGFEPWTSDGTQAGTRLLADLRPGEPGSVPVHFRSSPRGVVFVANDGSHGREPWLTDGTAAGTRMIADLCPGSCSYEPSLLGTAGDDLVIAGHEGPADLALWGSDGTPQGTVRLTVPGQGFLSTLYSLSTDRALYFNASDRAHGDELWITDATPGGTHLVIDLGADGSAGSFPGGLVEAPGKVYFTADDGVHGREPWVSDGTAAGTRMVADLVAGEQDYSGLIDVRLAVAGGHQFALVSRIDPFYVRLWRLGQTQGDAVLLLETPEVSCAPPFTCPLVAAGGRVFARIGDELWVSDGTPAGTRRRGGGTPGGKRDKRTGAVGGGGN